MIEDIDFYFIFLIIIYENNELKMIKQIYNKKQ